MRELFCLFWLGGENTALSLILRGLEGPTYLSRSYDSDMIADS